MIDFIMEFLYNIQRYLAFISEDDLKKAIEQGMHIKICDTLVYKNLKRDYCCSLELIPNKGIILFIIQSFQPTPSNVYINFPINFNFDKGIKKSIFECCSQFFNNYEESSFIALKFMLNEKNTTYHILSTIETIYEFLGGKWNFEKEKDFANKYLTDSNIRVRDYAKSLLI